MTTTCLDRECFRLLGTADPPSDNIGIPGICPGIGYDDVLSIIDLQQDVEDEEIPEKVMVAAHRISLDRGERSLVQVLRQVDGAAIVTNDEDAFDAIKELTETNVISTIPLMSLSLIEYMYRCSALTADQAVLLCQQAVESMPPQISEVKRNRKERQAEEIVQRIGLSEARREWR